MKKILQIVLIIYLCHLSIVLLQSYFPNIISLKQLRTNYTKEVSNLVSNDKTCRTAHDLYNKRRELGFKYKEATPILFRNIIYSRNIQKYGDPLGPSFNKLREKHSCNDIILSASTSSGKDLWIDTLFFTILSDSYWMCEFMYICAPIIRPIP